MPKSATPRLPALSPIEFAKQLGGLKLGALVGMAVAIIIDWIEPGDSHLSWADGEFTASCMVVGMAVQGCLHYFFGWWVDPMEAHLRARRDRQLALKRVAEAERTGALDRVECAKDRARINRRCINGGINHRRRRGPNQKREPDASGSARPAAVLAGAAPDRADRLAKLL